MGQLIEPIESNGYEVLSKKWGYDIFSKAGLCRSKVLDVHENSKVDSFVLEEWKRVIQPAIVMHMFACMNTKGHMWHKHWYIINVNEHVSNVSPPAPIGTIESPRQAWSVAM